MQSHASPTVALNDERRWLLPLVAIIAVAVVLVGVFAALASSANSGDYGWMMGGNWGWMWGMGALMMVIPLIFLVLLVVLILRPSSQQPVVVATSLAPDPFSEAQMRYARGEITSDQYRQIINDLRGAH